MCEAQRALARFRIALRRRRAEALDSPSAACQGASEAHSQLPPRPECSPSSRDCTFRKARATRCNKACGSATGDGGASCGLFRLLEEAGRCAALLFDTLPSTGTTNLDTAAEIVDNPCGWFVDVSAVVVSPMAIPSSPCSARDSPTSVSAPLPQTRTGEQGIRDRARPSVLQLSAHALTLIYDSLTSERAWDASFMRGPRSRHGMRRLATKHLFENGTDGWNVLIGALELARAWAIRKTSDIAPSSTNEPHRLDRNTRIRLAVCLSMSWKFQRSSNNYFAKAFTDVGEFHGWPDLKDGHTRELAFIGYAFLFPSEQANFGTFSEGNIEAVKQLYQTMFRLEVDLLKTVSTFSLLADKNVQVRAELLLEQLYLDKELTSAVGMSARSILPFLLRAALSSDTYEELVCDLEHGAQAIVCAACYCVAVAAVPHSDAHHDATGPRHPPRFDRAVRRTALALLHASQLHGDDNYQRHGCFGEAAWPNHVFVAEETLRRAKMALRSAGAR